MIISGRVTPASGTIAIAVLVRRLLAMRFLLLLLRFFLGLEFLFLLSLLVSLLSLMLAHAMSDFLSLSSPMLDYC